MTQIVNSYQSNPALKTVKAPEGWRGTPTDEKGRFLNLNHPFAGKWLDVFRWKFEKSPFRKEKEAESWKPDIFNDDYWLTRNENVIVWLGHSTFYIRIKGIQILIDPVFGDILGLKRKSALPVDYKRFVNINYILLSHDHRDHLDEKTLKLLSRQNPHTSYLTGLGMKTIVHKWTQSKNIQEAGWYQQYTTGDSAIKINFIPSRHWAARGINDVNQRLWGGFVIETESTIILFGGDSWYDTHYQQLAEVFGKIDYAILGICAYEPVWFMSANHQSPNDALTAFNDLKASHFSNPLRHI